MPFESIACCRIGLPGPGPTTWAVYPPVNVPLWASPRSGPGPHRAAASALKPDLVILDVEVSVLDGISAAERIAVQQIAPVVSLTAFSQREDPSGASEADTTRGAGCQILRKPAAMENLFSCAHYRR
jgi:CheY-like chemotaxis protein